jgi:hypothetical protein
MERRLDPRWLSPSSQELNRLLETLVNLMYLIRHDCDNSEKVVFYVDLAEKSIERMRAIVHESCTGYSPN